MNSDESIQLICLALSKIDRQLCIAKEHNYPSAFYEEFCDILTGVCIRLAAIDHRYGNTITDK